MFTLFFYTEYLFAGGQHFESKLKVLSTPTLSHTKVLNRQSVGQNFVKNLTIKIFQNLLTNQNLSVIIINVKRTNQPQQKAKSFLKKLKKTLDKLLQIWYNKYVIKRTKTLKNEKGRAKYGT